MEILNSFLVKNSLIFAFAATAIIIYLSGLISGKIFKNKIPGSALAIFIGLLLAYWGGSITGGEKGIEIGRAHV